jgi:hypothetical protein
MKNIVDVLRQKEAELQQLQKDIELLRNAMRLLADEGDSRPEPVMRPAPVPASRAKESAAEVGPRQFP